MVESTSRKHRPADAHGKTQEGENGPRTLEDTDLPRDETELHLGLVDILNIPQIQSLMEDFTKLTGIGNAILDMKGNLIESTGWSDICSKFHRANEQSRKFCTESDLRLAKDLKPGEIAAYKCKNNLWDFVTPIYVGKAHVGNIYTGQFFFEDEPIDEAVFIEQAERFGYDKDEYLAALRRVPRFSRDKVNAALDFLSRLARITSEMSYSNIRLAEMLEEQKLTEESLRDSEERYRRLAQNAPDVIYRVQYVPDVRLEFINPACETVFGYKPEEIMDKPDIILQGVHPDDRDLVRDEFESRENSPEPGAATIRIIHKNGKVIWCDIKFIRVLDREGRTVASEGIIRDISDKVAADLELRRGRELAEAATLKAQTYLDFIAHDLTNILSPVMAYAEMILANPESEPLVRSSAEKIMNQVGRASMFIRNTRRLSESEKSNVTDMEPVDLREVFESEESNIRTRYPSKRFEFNHRFSTEGPMTVRAREHVIQIIKETLDNAAKHCEEESPRVDITAREVEGTAGRIYWRVEIEDYGRGIPDKMKMGMTADAFDPENRFTRGIASTLSFMALIAEHVGGRMHIEDRIPGDHSKGTRIILLLPRSDTG